jgi:hypothetical protein
MQARDAAVAMPLRVQRVDEVMRQLEAGDLKLRVRVLEVRKLSTYFLVKTSPVKAQLKRASPDSQTTHHPHTRFEVPDIQFLLS